ncbi:MAG: aldo/keto reductase [Candidatus Nealsonbacteria bacterium]|nr:aldo/keto reductase [Candidatus Nealsonbacteria bacterium]
MPAHRVTRREFVRDTAAGAAALATGTLIVRPGNAEDADTTKIVNYNPDMEYRRCGKTDLMISAVCMGGHWKRLDGVIPGLFKGKGWLSADLKSKDFEKNRYDLVTRLIERGINYIDACTCEEIQMYSKALKGRRDKMHLGFSAYQNEVRRAPWRPFKKLQESLDMWMKTCGQDYVDVWRITMLSSSSRHTEAEVEETMKALEWAKKTGRARFTGVSSHDRPHIKKMIEKYPDQLDVIVTPYTSKTKVVEDKDGLWAAMKKCDVGWFGIKPYGGGGMFQGNGLPGNEQWEADCRIARLTIRYILCNENITAPIPGMIVPEQVDNLALAVKERRELDAEEKAELDRATERAFANLPYHYRWLNDWEYV